MQQTPQPRQRRAARYYDSSTADRAGGQDQAAVSAAEPAAATPEVPAAAAVRTAGEAQAAKQAPQHPQGDGSRRAARPETQRQAAAKAYEDELPVERSVRRAAEPPAERRPRSEAKAIPFPRWLSTALLAALILCLALFAANQLMRAYLTQQQQQREAAYQRVVENHPLLYRDWIEQYAAAYNLQPAFVASIILNESSYNPMAESNVGARGLMQLMEDTAEWVAGKLSESSYSFSRMWDPESNIRFGCWYLNYLAQLFGGDPVSVACAYHAGQGTVRNWLQNSAYSADGQALLLEQLPSGPTKTYAGRVTRDYAIYDQLFWHHFNADGSETEAPGAVAGAVPAARPGR